jgi:hypothetical protein
LEWLEEERGGKAPDLESLHRVRGITRLLGFNAVTVTMEEGHSHCECFDGRIPHDHINSMDSPARLKGIKSTKSQEQSFVHFSLLAGSVPADSLSSIGFQSFSENIWGS